MINQLKEHFAEERAAYTEHWYGERRAAVQILMIEQLKNIHATADLVLIIEVEKLYLENEFVHYCDNDDMFGSLVAAIDEVRSIGRLIPYVLAPESYATINNAFWLPQNRLSRLPYDEARQSFKSHAIRLMNLLTVPTDDPTWRGLISARLSNLRTAWKLYLAHQSQALKAD